MSEPSSNRKGNTGVGRRELVPGIATPSAASGAQAEAVVTAAGGRS